MDANPLRDPSGALGGPVARPDCTYHQVVHGDVADIARPRRSQARHQRVRQRIRANLKSRSADPPRPHALELEHPGCVWMEPLQ